ncbi:hypothetical protein PTKIN_Ptkin12aG0014500 [Pterospermum kingtungense]
MDDFGAQKQAVTEAEASDHKPKTIRGRQQKQKQGADDECENQQYSEADASNTRKRRGRKRTLTHEERHERSKQRNRDYRKDKKEERIKLQKLVEALEKENELLKEDLSNSNAPQDELRGQLSDVSEKLEEAKMVQKALEPGVGQLQQVILNQDDQKHRVGDLLITWDDVNETWGCFRKILDSMCREITGSLSGEGTSSGLSPFVELVNVEGFRVPKEYCAVIQEIFSRCPNIASGFQVRHPTTKNGFINTLAEVYKMAKEEQHTLEEIKDMEDGIADLELAGLNIAWLKRLVAKVRDSVEIKAEIENTKAELKLLKEMQSKIAEERKSLGQRYIQEFFSK